MSFSSLPYEVQSEILQYAIHFQPRHSILALPCVNSLWRDITLPLLHSHIRLTTLDQLSLFSNIVEDDPDPMQNGKVDLDHLGSRSAVSQPGLLRCCPRGRELEIHLTSGSFMFGTWPLIYKALKRCEHHDRQFEYTPRWFNHLIHSTSSIPNPVPPRDCCKGIRVLKFCFNASMNDYGLVLLGAVLSQIRPEEFAWTSPYSEGTAVQLTIPPVASLQLCKAIRTWDSLCVLHLHNIVFPDDGKEFMDAIINLNKPLRTHEQTIRSLTRLPTADESDSGRHHDTTIPPTISPTIGGLELSVRRATGLHPLAVVLIVLSQPCLTKFYIQDVYRHDVWSRKITFDEVERTFLALWDETDMRSLPEAQKDQWISQIRKAVQVENLSSTNMIDQLSSW